MPDVDELRTLVSQSCRIIGKENMTREPAGHVSARIPGTDRIVIKGRGPGEAALRYTMPDDLMIANMDGKKVEGRDDLTSPNEVFIHTELYRARPDVNCVIHEKHPYLQRSARQGPRGGHRREKRLPDARPRDNGRRSDRSGGHHRCLAPERPG